MLASFLLSFSCTPAGPPGVSLNSFLTQRPDLLSWVYVRPLAFGLSSNLSPHLALYRVRVPTFISLLHASFSHILSDAPLRFATLGDEYLRPVFHRQELRHARHTRKSASRKEALEAEAIQTCFCRTGDRFTWRLHPVRRLRRRGGPWWNRCPGRLPGCSSRCNSNGCSFHRLHRGRE